MSRVIVAALYHFTALAEHKSYREPLQKICTDNAIKGTILLAEEGINGTIAGSRAGIDVVLARLRDLPGCADLEHKESTTETPPFHRMKVRLKKEIVTMGQAGIKPQQTTGHYVLPRDWNDLIQSDDVVVIDTRNDYEVALGSFKNAVNPKTESFGGFPNWWQDNKDKFKGKKIAMFCTGGIRCEKSTSYLLAQGLEDVFHLKGGILKYLEQIPAQQSLWQGDCFVFDSRVSVGHGLKQGNHSLCYACRMPLSPADFTHPNYREGISCHQCFDKTDPATKQRFEERQKQIKLAKQRGKHHLG